MRTRHIILTIAVSVLLTPIMGLCQHFEFVISGLNMSILVQEATIAGELLQINDEIGVFDPDGVCAGATIVDEDGFPLGIAAWGDDPNTDFDEGFEPDDPIEFRFWDNDQEEEIVPEARCSAGRLIWQPNGMTIATLRWPGFPDIQLPVDNHNFGEVLVGENREWFLLIENIGEAPFITDDINIDSENFRIELEDEIHIDQGDEDSIRVLFEPQEHGELEAILTIRSVIDQISVNVDLAGMGIIPPRFSVDRYLIDFGEIATGPNQYEMPYIGYDTLHVSNEGDLELLVHNFRFSLPVIFALPGDFPDTLMISRGETSEIPLTFDPEDNDSSGTTYDESFSFSTNDSSNNEIYIQLVGTSEIPISVPEENESIQTGEFRLESAYPNPFNRSIILRLNTGSNRAVLLNIYDIHGRVVYSDALKLVKGLNNHQLNGEMLNGPGIFFAKVEFANSAETMKLLYLP